MAWLRRDLLFHLQTDTPPQSLSVSWLAPFSHQRAPQLSQHTNFFLDSPSYSHPASARTCAPRTKRYFNPSRSRAVENSSGDSRSLISIMCSSTSCSSSRDSFLGFFLCEVDTSHTKGHSRSSGQPTTSRTKAHEVIRAQEVRSSPGSAILPWMCRKHIPQLQARLLRPHKGNSKDAVAQLVLEPLLPRAQPAQPQVTHCSELCLLRLRSPGRNLFTCKEDMGGKGVGSHQDSRQKVRAVVKVEANKGCIPVDGWEDRLVACGIEEL